MKIVDTVCGLVLVLCVLGGCYRGFFSAALSLTETLLSIVLAALTTPFLAAAAKGNAALYNMLLYYTEGSEYVAKTSVELTRTSIHGVNALQLRAIIDRADMPLPMGERVLDNVAQEVFRTTGYTALGDYFNLTIVAVVINLICFFLCFLVFRLLMGLVMRAFEYGRGGFPLLSRFDTATGAGIGFLEGAVLLFVLFLLLPPVLTVLPKIGVYVNRSFFGEFFYRANPLYMLIPGT
ncbi:MAG: hypothetical protein Q4C53_00035 [Clostridia bacterium]|nr:hypothetical protein [Clostridia bacterium]